MDWSFAITFDRLMMVPWKRKRIRFLTVRDTTRYSTIPP
ncbi:hypothetical protein TC41_3266 [Alicyclobacillus acidocaldarius subsp. acidocaldarius Tc-4-1]|uniref:Uncharacterized protein n=1 Tax=Alicyclobacillus acidocaldarius (strain Tc-4-1) TaxID=1048834 RepID=F8IEA8_ALIAT|nr:hypothetical protein TC41_3266 [Alicyclobacillus acidocaldarius subsp. acidocaldarius Tc-4-1]